MAIQLISGVLFSLFLLSINSQETISNVKKCFCEWNQVQEENGNCVDHNATFVHIWNNETKTGNSVHLSEVSNVTVSPVECQSNYNKVVISNIAVLSTDGQLLPTPEPTTSDYCVENFLNPDGSPAQRYEYCITYDPFRLCCPLNQTMNEAQECVEPNATFPLSFDYVVKDVQCAIGNPILQSVHLDDRLVTLKRTFGYYTNSSSNNSCLVPHLTGGEVFYFLKSCGCEETTCVQSCCSPSDTYNHDRDKCETIVNIYEPVNFEFPKFKITPIPRDMRCNHSYVLDFSDTKHTLLLNGSLSPEVGQLIPFNHFCLGLIIKDNITVSSGLACAIDRPEPPCLWRFTIVQVFSIFSSIFIIITIGVYLSVKELRNRIGGASLISELFAMLFLQINLIVLQRNQDNFSPGGCLAAGVLEVIFVLAAFFWLNVMCFDMWTTFRELQPFSQKILNKKLFLKYSLYAWGVPVLIGMIVLAVELLDLYPRPSFTIYEGCFFNDTAEDKIARWVYLYSVIVLLLLINTFFFLNVVYKLSVMKKEQRKFLGKNSRRGDKAAVDQKSIQLYGKLFLIMGLPWLIEAFTSFGSGNHECYIWIFDIINLLRGVFIFCIFVWKKSTRKKIINAWTNAGASSGGSSSDRSRKTSTISLTSWLPSRKLNSNKSALKTIEEDTN